MTILVAVATIPDDTMGGDLRPTLGWRLTSHARRQAANRGITVREVLAVVAACEAQYPGRAGRTVLCGGTVIAVVDHVQRTVVTTYRAPLIRVA
jgi:hypothetical protein